MALFDPRSLEIASSVFTADERIVIDYWLEHPGETPSSRRPRDARFGNVRSGCEDREQRIRTRLRTVARIALAALEDRLPQWAFVTESDITLGRDVRPPKERFKGPVQMRSRFLFSLDWAASSPGGSWPRAYYATWLPAMPSGLSLHRRIRATCGACSMYLSVGSGTPSSLTKGCMM